MTSNAAEASNDQLKQDGPAYDGADHVHESRPDDEPEEEEEEDEGSEALQAATPGIRTPHDLASEIANFDDEMYNSQDITPDTASLNAERLPHNETARAQAVEESTLPPEAGDEVVADVPQSESSVDHGPSVRSSPPSTPDSSRPASSLSLRSGQSPRRSPFEKRFHGRKPSATQAGVRNLSPAFLSSHSRQASASSVLSNVSTEKDDEDDAQNPWEVIKWTRLKKLSAQIFSETSKRAFGTRTFLVVGASIIMGTSKGLILILDYQQNLKAVIGQGSPAPECGAITAMAVSADHSTVAGGHANGFIFTWEVSNPSKPFLMIPSIPRSKLAERTFDAHVENNAVIHIGFLGTRHTALVSADDSGMAFSHLATRGLGALGRTVKSTRILGRYPAVPAPSANTRKPSSVLAFAPLPLGNVEQPTDDMGLTALLTPYLLVLVSTTPIAQTHYKSPRAKDIPAHIPMTGCLAWFPAVKLKATSGPAAGNSLTKLAFCWSTILTILEIDVEPNEEKDEDKRPMLRFVQSRKWKADEPIVAVQWISRSVMAVLTITQRLIIVEDGRMRVSDSSDLNPRQIYHRDVFSRQLEPLVSNAEQEDTSMHGVIPDAYHMSFKAYKGRLFLLDDHDITMGTLSNWADRLVALMEARRPLQAIRLATDYYDGVTDKVTVGLPEDDIARQNLLRSRLRDLVLDSLKFTFKMDEEDQLGTDIRTALDALVQPVVGACLSMNDMTFLYDEVYEFYSDASCQDLLFYTLEPRIIDGTITAVSPGILKEITTWYYTMGLTSRLEAMICSLQTDTLDIDQVTSLCREHFLYDALIHVWNRAVGDYVTPLMELLALSKKIPTNEFGRDEDMPEFQASMKVFPYLALSLTGRRYPGGEEMPPYEADKARATLYGVLFGGFRSDSPGSNHGGHRLYSTLRSILHFDTPEFMSTLNEAFEDAFLNGDDEHAINGDFDGTDEKIMAGLTVNRQLVVQVLLEVLASQDYADVDRLYLDIFIARNIPKFQHQRYILLQGSILHQILLELCNCREEFLAEECQLSVEYLLSAYQPPDLQDFIPRFEQAGFYRILKMTLKASKQYAQWLEAHFADPNQPSAVFDAIVESLRSGNALSARQVKEVKKIVEDHAEHLAHLDVERMALVLDRASPDLLKPCFDRLEKDSELQLAFLQVLLEPREEQASPSTSEFSLGQRDLYVKLMCKHAPSHVSDYVSLLDANDLKLSEVLPVIESTGVIDAAVTLMAKGGLVQDAMARLVKHLSTLRAAISGLSHAGEDSDDDSDASDGLFEIVGQVDKFAKLGIWLCQGLSTQTSGAAAQRKLRMHEMTEDKLSPAERCWLDLVSEVVGICIAASPPSRPANDSHDRSSNAARTPQADAASALRNTLQQCFTALLSASATSPAQKSNALSPRLLPILRLFLTRLSHTTSPISSDETSTSQSATMPTLLPVLQSLFSAYAFESFLLSLSAQLLATDVFGSVAAADAARRRGWRPATRACAVCGARAWGVGAGAGVWDAWANRAKRAERARRLRAGGQGAAADEGSALDEGDDDGDEHDGDAQRGTHDATSRPPSSRDKGKGRLHDSAATEDVADTNAAAEPASGDAAAVSSALVAPPTHSPPPPGRDALAVFACGHLFHRTCLRRRVAEAGGHGNGASSNEVADADEEVGALWCVMCEG